MAEPKVYPIYKGQRVSKLSRGLKDHYKGTLNPTRARTSTSTTKRSGS